MMKAKKIDKQYRAGKGYLGCFMYMLGFCLWETIKHGCGRVDGGWWMADDGWRINFLVKKKKKMLIMILLNLLVDCHHPRNILSEFFFN